MSTLHLYHSHFHIILHIFSLFLLLFSASPSFFPLHSSLVSLFVFISGIDDITKSSCVGSTLRMKYNRNFTLSLTPHNDRLFLCTTTTASTLAMSSKSTPNRYHRSTLRTRFQTRIFPTVTPGPCISSTPPQKTKFSRDHTESSPVDP